MKREKLLTKRERKAAKGAGPAGQPKEAAHIHCITCGRHINPSEFHAPATAVRIACQHKSLFPSCAGCVDRTRELLAEHDRTGQPVKTAAAWH